MDSLYTSASWGLKVHNKTSSVIPFTFNVVDLYVVTINDKPWTRAEEVCRALKYNKKSADLIKAFRDRENYA